ncbi:MAG TPA: endonuclease [Myxococcota bacterium]|nr:endonuclease [Myxococcota bacterium]
MTCNMMGIYGLLLEDGGHQHWWPGETAFEVAVGAVLTQNTSFSGVTKAIDRMKAAGLMSPAAIVAAPDDIVGQAIRPSGYFNVKTARLKALCRFLLENDAADPASLARFPVPRLRQMLLAVHGVGRETADSIILYATNRPIFVIDAYTRRIFSRMGLVQADADYDDLRDFFERSLPRDAAIYNDFHAQIVRCAKECCRKRPNCGRCALRQSCRTGMAEA